MLLIGVYPYFHPETVQPIIAKQLNDAPLIRKRTIDCYIPLMILIDQNHFFDDHLNYGKNLNHI